jgi:hypothetical protein
MGSAGSVRADGPTVPMAKARWVQMPVETPVSVEMGVHDESISILKNEENNDGTIMVEAADATTIV